MDSYEILGSNVRRLRERQGWSLEEMAQRIDYSAGGLSEVENGKRWPRKAALERIAALFGVEVADLLKKPA